MNFITQFIQSQTYEPQDLTVVALLTVLEGLLSIDNALVLGLLAKRLPKHLQGQALNIGLILAVVFRVTAIFMASLLLRWTIVKLFGGGYLVYIAARHLLFEAKDTTGEQVVLDEHGHPTLVEPTGEELTPTEREEEIRERVPVYVKSDKSTRAFANFWPTVISIGLTDIAFAVDSILAAIALVGNAPPTGYHPKLWVVVTGGFLGIILLRFAAGVFVWLLGKFPRFEIAAYLLVLVIGCKLLADWGFNSDWEKWSPGFEHRRQAWAASYEKWLSEKWILKIQPHTHEPAHDDAKIAPPAVTELPAPADHPAAPAAQLPQPPVHLLDFHNLRRPECITFWLLMLTSFLTGFLPTRHKSGSAAEPAG